MDIVVVTLLLQQEGMKISATLMNICFNFGIINKSIITDSHMPVMQICNQSC